MTIRNLEERVKQKLREQAACNGRSMEAEAREILAVAVTNADNGTPFATKPIKDHQKSVCQAVRGIWKGRTTTDEIMVLTRGD